MWINLKRQDVKNNFISLSAAERLSLLVKSALAIVLLDYCFYQKAIALLPLLVPGFFFYQMEKKELLHKKREEIRQQFKEMLMLAVTGLKAGSSVENAFLRCYENMENLYGEESSICKMLSELKEGLLNNRRAADLWKSMGDSCKVVEIQEFAAVFAIAKESSGNMVAIMERTAQAIGNKAETQKEIETLLSARRLEQKIMNIMPIFLMLYISVTSPGYFEGFYHSVSGVAIMTISLLVYLSAYLLGVKIAAVKV